jgi:hypothetical protein
MTNPNPDVPSGTKLDPASPIGQNPPAPSLGQNGEGVFTKNIIEAKGGLSENITPPVLSKDINIDELGKKLINAEGPQTLQKVSLNTAENVNNLGLPTGGSLIGQTRTGGDGPSASLGG